jgi:hypothetical protein
MCDWRERLSWRLRRPGLSVKCDATWTPKDASGPGDGVDRGVSMGWVEFVSGWMVRCPLSMWYSEEDSGSRYNDTSATEWLHALSRHVPGEATSERQRGMTVAK